jgi:hypothetical protein
VAGEAAGVAAGGSEPVSAGSAGGEAFAWAAAGAALRLKGNTSISTMVIPVRDIPMASPVSREISAIRSEAMGIRPLTVASTDWLFRKLVIRTLVLKDKLGWEI